MLNSTTLRPASEPIGISVLLELETPEYEACLKAFALQTYPAKAFEIICLTPEGQTLHQETLAKFQNRLQISLLPLQVSCRFKRLAQAAKAAKYDYVLLWSSDFLPHPDNLQSFVKMLNTPLTQDVLLGACHWHPQLANQWLNQALLSLGLPFHPPPFQPHSLVPFAAVNLVNLVLRREILDHCLKHLQDVFQSFHFYGLALGLGLWSAGYRPVFEPEARAFYTKIWELKTLYALIGPLAEDSVRFLATYQTPLENWEMAALDSPLTHEKLQSYLNQYQPQAQALGQKVQRLETQPLFPAAPQQSEYSESLIAAFADLRQVFLLALYAHVLEQATIQPEPSKPPLIYPGYREKSLPEVPDAFKQTFLSIQSQGVADKVQPELSADVRQATLCAYLASLDMTQSLITNFPVTLADAYLLSHLSRSSQSLQPKIWQWQPAAHFSPQAEAQWEALFAQSLSEVLAPLSLSQVPESIDILLLLPQSFENIWQTFIQANPRIPTNGLCILSAPPPLAQGFIALLESLYPYALLSAWDSVYVFYKLGQPVPPKAWFQASQPLLYYQDYYDLYAPNS